jgi:hypothetical protein
MTRYIAVTLAGGLILTTLQAVVGMAMGPMPVESPPNVLPWLLVSNTAIAGLLTWFASQSSWTGLRLAGALFAIAYGIRDLNSLIEAYFLDFFKRPGEFGSILAHSLLVSLMFAPLVVLLAGRWQRPGSAGGTLPRRTVGNWAARIAACGVVYLVCYFIFGLMVLPYVRHFYTELPDPVKVFLLQLVVRGPLFAICGLMIASAVPASRRAHALMVAVALSVLGGFAPLIVPNPYLPDEVRWAHFVEVVSENFVYGAFVGWLLGGSRQESQARVLTSAA